MGRTVFPTKSAGQQDVHTPKNEGAAPAHTRHNIEVRMNLGTARCVCTVTSHSLRPRQAPLSMGLSRREDWSGLPCPPAGDLPDPGIQPRSPALQADSSLSEPPTAR